MKTTTGARRRHLAFASAFASGRPRGEPSLRIGAPPRRLRVGIAGSGRGSRPRRSYLAPWSRVGSAKRGVQGGDVTFGAFIGASTVEAGEVMRKILGHIGLPAEPASPSQLARLS